MANLYDLELQESNDLIHAFICNGETPELKKMRAELEQARRSGPEQANLVSEYLDQKTTLGSKLKRYTELESDIRLVMQINELTPDLATKADRIFSKKPDSIKELTDEEKRDLTTYWLKKKTCLADLIKRGYSFEELFSTVFYQPTTNQHC